MWMRMFAPGVSATGAGRHKVSFLPKAIALSWCQVSGYGYNFHPVYSHRKRNKKVEDG